MKILHICAYAAPYGGNFLKSLLFLDKEVQKKGYETVFCFPEKNKDLDWCKQLEVTYKVYYVPLAHARILLKTYLVLKRIFKENPDIVIAHSHFELYDEPLSITAPRSVKVFWHVHDAIGNYLHGFYKWVWKAHYNLFIKNVQLLSVSEKHKDVIINLGFPKERIHYVPNGIDTSTIDLVESTNKQPFVFTVFGWDYFRKGVDLAIDAMNNVKGMSQLHIVGGSNKEADTDKIRQIVPSKNINDIFKASSCFLHISRAEGLSYALLEALYFGLPVIVSDIPENLITKDCPTAYYVKSESVNEIKDWMQRFINEQYHCTTEEIMKTREIIDCQFSLIAWSKQIIKHYGI